MSETNFRIWPGEPYPLGATWDGGGVNFALFSEHAERVELCLFDEAGMRELTRIRMPEYTNEVWHCYLPDARPGQLYGYRVFGPYDPPRGHRFNHHKLLLDPYAKAIRGELRWTDRAYGYVVGDRRGDLSFDVRDNAPDIPKCEVVDTAFTWREERRPRRPWPETVIYEMHARGFTQSRPDVPERLRGTVAGLSTPAVIQYLTDLGITAVELLPIHAFIDEHRLVEKGLRNYWGYNSIGFFAPQSRYLSNGSLSEFKIFVQALHDAGIEVILDVVYNHTAEGNHMGPTLCFRGIDNACYYRLASDTARHYEDFTGCGNALNLHHHRVMQLVMDSLRYWVEDMHVDGFRFDLSTTLARGKSGAFDGESGFLDAVRQDPTLSTVKLIAEPWDLGNDGYRLGQFPPGWAEWNDRYRDTVRRFWKGDDGLVGEVASRITGSSDVFERGGRRPWSSVNFVTAHDGYTLRDLVTYEKKYNEDNLEDNRDGTDYNQSWNCGAEGPTNDPKIRELRLRQIRNMMATLLLSQGVPMLTAGDEFGRTQRGNNNGYCQDNELGWIDWSGIDGEGRGLLEFTKSLIALRADHIAFRRSRFFHGRRIPGTEIKDITWLRPDGLEKTGQDWEVPETRYLGFLLSGESGAYFLTARGQPEPDQSFFVLMNAHDDDIAYKLPAAGRGVGWTLVVDTTMADHGDDRIWSAGAEFVLASRSLAVFASTNDADGG